MKKISLVIKSSDDPIVFVKRLLGRYGDKPLGDQRLSNGLLHAIRLTRKQWVFSYKMSENTCVKSGVRYLICSECSEHIDTCEVQDPIEMGTTKVRKIGIAHGMPDPVFYVYLKGERNALPMYSPVLTYILTGGTRKLVGRLYRDSNWVRIPPGDISRIEMVSIATPKGFERALRQKEILSRYFELNDSNLDSI